MTESLDTIINEDQKAFNNGKFIWENTQLTSDIIRKCVIQKKDELIVIVACEKAFDSMSCELMENHWNSLLMNYVLEIGSILRHIFF